MQHLISIRNIVPSPNFSQKLLIWLLDRLLGIKRMNTLYQEHQMQGLSKEAFSDRIFSILNLDIKGIETLQANIPKTGPVVIASNHPFGGIEGVILARAIGEVRPDLKVLANKGLGIFKELRDYFIFTNPLSPNDPKNGPSLRQCMKHVQNNGALLLFPAGKVSYFEATKSGISEHTWNKLVGRLISVPQCQYVPVFVDGSNSKTFYRIERVYFKLRMLFLGRELLNKSDQVITINSGKAVKEKQFDRDLNYSEKANLCRALSYAQEGSWRYEWPADTEVERLPIIDEIAKEQLITEIEALPCDQLLLTNKGYSVYFGYQSQLPLIVQEIARLREIVFRMHNEGSGQALDTDHYDASYTHLFIVDNQQQKIVGAYRMGLSDNLQEKDGIEGLYLHKMFKFHPSFANQKGPCMEMGRSFLIPEMQGSYQGLLLLWKGIGRFAAKFPQYRTLYGTVSISKLFDPRSVKLIEQAYIDSESASQVSPYNAFEFESHSEIDALAEEMDLKAQLSAFLSSIENDGKDVPVLARQYLKMGGKFHALGIDKSFNHTPGLLLSVHFPSAPEKLLKLYVGEDYQAYKDWKPTS
ncbi:lysophospholipid acyltransferase family protein [Glaciecola sp. MH2013]|uniref:lysophospholipid acyltransferase family protein n=1 Tax=Glaciecola sp. MH2013 TaxID=2785524 RepID=UPI00189F15A0|nr:lysophospholipid acyltransferase family protein [Glaciecola sp. MH2013]MBF7074069.1 lysophospholipid acyltransferase family protein [Glaciecola sp. MH2013]